MNNEQFSFLQALRFNDVSKKKKKKKVFVFVLLSLLIVISIYLAVSSFADPAVPSITFNNEMYFELEHNLTNAKYKYYGYGYTLSVFDNDKKYGCH